jgi:hypothetical protein
MVKPKKLTLDLMTVWRTLGVNNSLSIEREWNYSIFSILVAIGFYGSVGYAYSSKTL